MNKNILFLQLTILLAGTIFAFATVINDFRIFYDFYNTIFRIKNCVIPNPVTTPCFYGAFGFMASLIWTYIILKMNTKTQVKSQKRLLYLLAGGTVFAWGNMSYLFYKFYFVGSNIGCSGAVITNPFTTACFVGSVLFLLSLITGIFAYRSKKA